jgi:hypothetical protein
MNVYQRLIPSVATLLPPAAPMTFLVNWQILLPGTAGAIYGRGDGEIWSLRGRVVSVLVCIGGAAGGADGCLAPQTAYNQRPVDIYSLFLTWIDLSFFQLFFRKNVLYEVAAGVAPSYC